MNGDGYATPEGFYERNAAKIKRIFKDRSNNSVVRALAADFELLTFLIFSPAHLIRLETEINQEVSNRSILLAASDRTVETIAVLRAAVRGVRIHFGSSTLEEGWLEMMQFLTDCMQESSSEAVTALARQVRRVGNILISGKNRIETCELSVLNQDQWAFAEEFGLNTTWQRRWRNIMLSLKQRVFGITYGEFAWIKHQPSIVSRFQGLTKTIFVKVVCISLNFIPLAERVIIRIMACAYAINILRCLPSLSFVITKWLFRRQITGFLTQRLFYTAFVALVMILWFAHTLKRKNGVTLQALGGSRAEKKFMMGMTCCIGFMYIFDVDLADTLLNSVNKISRMSSYLMDDYRGFGSKLLDVQHGLQAGDDESDSSTLVTSVLDIMLHIVDDDETDKVANSSDESFQGWMAVNHATGKNLARPLQYPVSEIYALNKGNAEEIAARMLGANNRWSSIVGQTGSGKSTYLPVCYFNMLQQTPGRKHKILICEPTQAATENVCQGVSANFGQAVYGRHEDWRNLGDQRIQVMTYGSALQAHVNDPAFISSFDAIFLDEAHDVKEHSLVFESLCDERTMVRKFYVSATPRDGKRVPESERAYALDVVANSSNSVIDLIKAQGEGGALDVREHKTVLVFLAGKAECVKAANRWNAASLDKPAYYLNGDNFKTHFKTVTEALRTGSAIVFCTNIIETGVTLNVDCVVDYGFTMRPELDLNMKTLKLVRKRVTQNERHQRVGRAGRMKKGFAYACGNVDDSTNVVSPDVLYGAAILSFLHNTRFYMNEKFESSWIEGITRRQAETMAMFKIPIFLTRDLVNRDGSIDGHFLKVLQPHMFQSCDIKQAPATHLRQIYSSWPQYSTLHNMIHYGDKEAEFPRDLIDARIPFVVSTLHKFDWEELARACKNFKPRVSTIFQEIDEPKRRAILKTDPYNIEASIAFLETLANNTMKFIQSNKMARSNIQCNFFSKFGGVQNCVRKLNENEKRYIDNHTIIQKHLSTLRLIHAQQPDIHVEASVSQNLDEMIELQAQQILSVDEVARVLGIPNPRVNFAIAFLRHGPKFVLSCLVLVAASIAYTLYSTWWKQSRSEEKELVLTMQEANQVLQTSKVMKARGSYKPRNDREAEVVTEVLQHHYNEDFPARKGMEKEAEKLTIGLADYLQLEGKGNKYRYDKKLQYTSRDEENVEDFNRKAKSKRSKLVKESRPETQARSGKQGFYNFYDLTSDNNIINVLFKDAQGRTFHSTKRPLEDIRHAHLLLAEHLESQPLASTSWAEEMEDQEKMTCHVFDTFGREHIMNMTTHRSARTTDLANMGFAEREGEFRQTGATETIHHGLEGSAQIPMTQCLVSVANNVGVAVMKDFTVNCYLYGDWIIMPAHIQMKSGDITLTFEGIQIKTTTEELNNFGVKRFSGIDVLLVRRPSQLRPRKKVTQAAVMEKGKHVQMVFSRNGQVYFSQSDIAQAESSGRWSHTITTKSGMCGCPVFSVQSNHLVGIHVATNHITRRNEFQSFTQDVVDFLNGPGRFQSIERWEFDAVSSGYLRGAKLAMQSGQLVEVMNQTIDGFGFTLKGQHVREPSPEVEARFRKTFPDSSFTLLAEMNKGLIDKHIYVGENTEIFNFMRDNPYYEWLDEYMDDYAPSVLSYTAYFKDLKKFDRPLHVTRYNPTELEAAMKYVIKQLDEAGMQHCEIRTAEQVVDDLQWATSAGPAYQGKKRDVCAHLHDEDMFGFAEVCRKKFLDGSSHGIWNGSLKAELRAIEKVEQQKTRVFTAAPITSLLAMKFYVDHFNKQFYGTHLKAPHTVGINKFNRGWEKLYNKLNKEGWLHGSGDGSRFDSSIDPFLFDVVKKIRKHYLDEAHHAAIDIIYQEIQNTTICLANGMVIKKRVGNNSGQPSTVVDNTLVLMVAFAYAYIHKTQDLNCNFIDERFRFVCNGDDNKFSISPEFEKEFGHDFSEEMRDLGLTYEFDDITTDICENPYMSLTMVRTKYGVGFSLSLERIIAILQWRKKGGLLHAYLSGISAAVESFNTPKIFCAIYSYLLNLIAEKGDELIEAMESVSTAIPLPSMLDIQELHYNEEIELQAGSGSGDTDTGSEQKGKEKVTGDQSTDTSEAAWKAPKVTYKSMTTRFKVPLKVMQTVPRKALEFDNKTATEKQRKEWVSAVKQELNISNDGDWNSLMPSWIMWCAHNGTSEDTDENQIMEINYGNGSTNDVPIRPFITHARSKGTTLRKIMRCYSDDAVYLLAQHHIVTKWAMAHGIADPNPYAFDFFVPAEGMNKAYIEQAKQARLAAIGVGVTNSMITSDKTNMRQSTTKRIMDVDGRPSMKE